MKCLLCYNIIKEYSDGEYMRYVMSDPHGEMDLFLALLNKINFSEKDVLYICGDIIDKGKRPIELLRFVMSKQNIHTIMGNHEQMFLKYYHSLCENCREDFDAVLNKLREYFPEDGYLLDWTVVDFIESLPYFIEKDDFICVHAGLPLDENGCPLPPSVVDENILVNDRRFSGPTLVSRGEKCVFFGHTQTNGIADDAKILAYRHRDRAPVGTVRDYYKIHLDTGAWVTGTMGCFCIDTCRAYYVDKRNNDLTAN